MDKKLKKKVELQLVAAMEGVLSGINRLASDSSKKKVKEAGKMVAKKFAKTVYNNNGSLPPKKKIAKKPFKKPVMPKRASNGKFIKTK
jgi:hypothetical protein